MFKHTYRLAVILFGCMVVIGPLRGQKIPVAVAELEGRGVSTFEVAALSDRLRNELFRLGTYDVVEREMMEEILQEQDFQLSG
ncbi:CsgG/HfaB family protein [Candidatus Neomarinimicrobiota bacterium]